MMKALEEKIISEGEAIGTEILKVDGFINHRLDVEFLDLMGEEVAKYFKPANPTKILTVEASGIAVACSAARALGYLPVIFAKKTVPNTMSDDFYSAECRSFTKGTVSALVVSKKFISEGDRILIVDDFLAHGEASGALCDICEAAGATVAGVCCAIEKQFQGGSAMLRKRGITVKSLAVISEMVDGVITFAEEE